MGNNGIRLLTGVLAACAMLLAGCGSGGGGDDAAQGETQVVTDDLGTRVTVPVAPQRVVTTHFLVTMSTLDLGLTPVGTAVWSRPVVTEAYAATLANVPVVTSQSAEPDLEQIAAQSPDLIIATSFSNEQVLGRLRQIAPTYVLTVSEGGANAVTFAERNRKIADVLGRTPEYDRLAADFEDRKQRIKQAYAARINGRTAA
ncbi:hypothetical protein D8M34_18275, partial [Microbacterium sp. HSID17254]|uniref:ABC transporter substrate-binding protein n=1 Tax=Microbacterium sp. HSID17254 TaxID=2419509 RepID=UPI000F952A28